MQISATCFPEHELRSFVAGDLPDRRTIEMEEHLSTCDSCRAALEDVAGDREWWSDVAISLRGTTLTEPRASSGRELGDSTHEGEHIAAHVLELLGPTDDPHMMGRIGSYEIVGVLGQGGMGTVFKAFDSGLNRYVAIKVLLPHLASSGAARARFRREGQAAAAVIDDHVLPIYAVDQWRDTPYLVMQYTRGVSLQKRLHDQGPLALREILRIGLHAARGLAAAHAQGLVHRDIKPSNILLDSTVERSMLTDFGLARAVDDASLTVSGVIAGTPQYMSPEQARAESIDNRSDLFSLGSVMYAMSTGHAPFRAESSYGVLRLITDKEPRPIQELNPDIPQWLCAIISKLMSKQASDRFDTAEQVAELLEDCLAHVQQPTTTPLPASHAALTSGNNRWPPFGKHSGKPFGKHFGKLFNKHSGKRVAAVFFAFSLIFASVLVVLEMSRGTLTIESNSQNGVPIIIRQGDNEIERLTVTQNGTKTRLSAGKYVVEIDGDDTDFSMEGDQVVLSRGGEWIAKVIAQDRSRASKASSATDLESQPTFDTGDLPASVGLSLPNDGIQIKSNIGNRRRSQDSHPDLESLISVDLTGDEGIDWLFDDEPLKRESLGFEINLDNVSGASIVDFVDARGRSIHALLRMECADASDRFWETIEGAKVSIHVSHEDFDNVLDGKLVTKVVILPNNQPAGSPARLETLDSSKLKDGIDVMAEAKRRGQRVVSFKLSPRTPSVHFETPGALMKYAVDCQKRSDDAGWIACWTEDAVRQLATSYMMTATVLLRQYNNPMMAMGSSKHRKQASDIQQLLDEELPDELAAAALEALVQGKDEGERRFAYWPSEKATMNSPIVQRLSKATADHLRDPRRFVLRFLEIGDQGAEPKSELRPQDYAYTIKQNGDVATATFQIGRRELSLIKTATGWLISEPVGMTNEIEKENAEKQGSARQH